MDQTIAQRNLALREHMLQLAGPEGWDATIAATRSSLAGLAAAPWLPKLRNVLLVGHGTSYATASNIESWLSHIARVNARALPAFQVAQYPDDHLLDPESALVIGISCSGNTASVVNALQRANERGAATMLISGSVDCEGARVAGSRILTLAEVERAADVSAYSVSHLYIALAGFEFALLLGRARGVLDEEASGRWSRALESTLGSLGCLPGLFDEMGEVASDLATAGIDTLCVLGTGPNIGTMLEGALKISEFCWLFGAAEELEDFAHGRFREVGSANALFVIAPSGPAVAKTMDILAGCSVSGTPAIVFTDAPSPAMRALAWRVVELPALESEYLTPFLYVFPHWFLGWHLRNDEGGLVGDKRHGLLAVDINFEKHFDSMGNRKTTST